MIPSIHPSIHPYIHTHTHIHTYIHTYNHCTHTCIHTIIAHIHTYIHAYIQSLHRYITYIHDFMYNTRITFVMLWHGITWSQKRSPWHHHHLPLEDSTSTSIHPLLMKAMTKFLHKKWIEWQHSFHAKRKERERERERERELPLNTFDFTITPTHTHLSSFFFLSSSCGYLHQVFFFSFYSVLLACYYIF